MDPKISKALEQQAQELVDSFFEGYAPIIAGSFVSCDRMQAAVIEALAKAYHFGRKRVEAEMTIAEARRILNDAEMPHG